MRAAHQVAAVRAAEDALRATLPDGALMQRAAAGLAVACAQRLGSVYGSEVLLLVGSGDNGADALWAGARLAARGAAVTAALAGEPRPDALAAFRRAGGRVGDLSGPDLVVDGLLGIGGRGGLRPDSARVAALAGGADVVAVDLPSGVDADTGNVLGAAVHADLTVTFGTLKPGLLVGPGRAHAGVVHLVDIGLGPWLPPGDVHVLESQDVDALLPTADAVADKYTRGVLGVAAGSQTYPGAAVLAVGSAVRAGAGMVRFAGAPLAVRQVLSRWPEAVAAEALGAGVVDVGRVQAWVVGPGLGTDGSATDAVRAVLETDVPVLVDADGLTVLAQHPEWVRGRTAPTVLTPHDREYARFGQEVGDDRVAAASALAAELGCTVLLKGDATVVAGAGRVLANATGTAALATAGSGDVLAGAVGALLAQGVDAVDAAAVGAHLHGLAGQLSARGASTSASSLLQSWPDAVRAARAGRLHP